MANRKAGTACACLGLLILLLSCALPQGIALFADSAGTALDEGPSLFRDIHDSCIRRHVDAQPIKSLFLPNANNPISKNTNEFPVCAAFVSEGEALTKASGILAAYFKAMHQLASFDTSTVSAPSEQAAENAATTANLSSVQIDSIGKLAGFVTQAFTERYRHSHLVKYLREADPSIASVTQGFEDVVSKDYAGLLQEERQALTAQYQNAGDIKDPAVLLLLNRAYTDDMNELNRRKAAADAYVGALQQIREGHHELAGKADHLNGKAVSVALQPYTERLQALIPALQKGF